MLTLHVADTFERPFGVYLVDGEGGNLAGGVLYVEDPPQASAIRLKGRTTEVARWLPEWARWAVHEFAPVVEREVDPGEFRVRKVLDIQVNWTLPKKTQRSLARATEAHLRTLYSSFVYAHHDQEGRPFHEGLQVPRPAGRGRAAPPHGRGLADEALAHRLQEISRPPRP